jgi:hypothetical protein
MVCHSLDDSAPNGLFLSTAVGVHGGDFTKSARESPAFYILSEIKGRVKGRVKGALPVLRRRQMVLDMNLEGDFTFRRIFLPFFNSDIDDNFYRPSELVVLLSACCR